MQKDAPCGRRSHNKSLWLMYANEAAEIAGAPGRSCTSLPRLRTDLGRARSRVLYFTVAAASPPFASFLLARLYQGHGSVSRADHLLIPTSALDAKLGWVHVAPETRKKRQTGRTTTTLPVRHAKRGRV